MAAQPRVSVYPGEDMHADAAQPPWSMDLFFSHISLSSSFQKSKKIFVFPRGLSLSRKGKQKDPIKVVFSFMDCFFFVFK